MGISANKVMQCKYKYGFLNMKAKILVATHKPYRFPENRLYVPIQVGKALASDKYGYLLDDERENISERNRSYSELTALYWAWKNRYFDACDLCGLVHYRRYFFGSEPFGSISILGEKELAAIMGEYDMIVPKKRHYYIETVRNHYVHAHHAKDLDALESVVAALYPEYVESFDAVMQQRSLYLYNMFVMRSEAFDAYCTWLFAILFEVEKRIDISGYDAYQARVFGFLAERLFNVWLHYHGLKVKELSVVNLEGENLLLKAFNMIKRKYLK